MKFGAVPVNEAIGGTAVHSIRQGDLVLRKGTLKSYRKAVETFNQSMRETQGKLEGEVAQDTLARARSLSTDYLQTETAFDQLLAYWGEAMAQAAEQVGGALEWNRYLQADIQTLRDNSATRRQQLEAVYQRFPVPNSDAAAAESATTGAPDPHL